MQRLHRKLFLLAALLALLAAGRAYAQNLSLDIDGNDDDVTVDLRGTSIFFATDFTTELWFRPENPSTSPLCPDGMRTLYHFVSQSTWVEVGVCNGQLMIGHLDRVVPVTLVPPISVAPVSNNQWYHIRMDYNNGNWNFYLDCQLVHTFTAVPTTRHEIISLGEYLNPFGLTNPQHWDGRVDELKIWDNIRPVASCPDRFCPAAGNETGLLAYLDFDQGTGGGNNAPLNLIQDQTSNGNDGVAANFAGTGNSSNLLGVGAPLTTPILHGLDLTIRDYPYQNDTLTTICDGDPAVFLVELNGSVPGPFGNVTVNWEYSDDGGTIWQPLATPPFTDFQFPILPGTLTANCGSSPTGFVDRLFRATATVNAGTARACSYQSDEYALRICCPIGSASVDIQPNAPLCEGDVVNLNVSLNAAPWIITPGPHVSVSWEITDQNGTRPLPFSSTAFPYPYTAPALSAPMNLCFTANITNCGGKIASVQSCLQIDPEPECGLVDALPLGSPRNLALVSTSPHPTYEICPGNDAVVGIDPANPFNNCNPQWQYSFDNLNWTDLGFSNSVQNTNILPSHLWPAGADRIYYRIECRPLSNPSGCDPCYSNLIEIRLAQPVLAPAISGSTQECLENMPTVLSVVSPVAGTTYQWLHNGLPVGTGPNLTATAAGCYWLESSNRCFTTVSNKHCLEVCETVAVLSCPIAPNECARLGEKVILDACDSYSTCGTGPFTYTWYLDGVLVPSFTGCQFSFNPPAAGSTVEVEVKDRTNGCVGRAKRTVVPCEF